MFQLNRLNAALLAALCAPAFAQSEAISADDGDAAFSLQAAAPVTSAATLVKAAPTAAETRARSYQGWMTQLGRPLGEVLCTICGSGAS